MRSVMWEGDDIKNPANKLNIISNYINKMDHRNVSTRVISEWLKKNKKGFVLSPTHDLEFTHWERL